MSRYRDISIRRTQDGVRYKKSVIYPDITLSENDIYVTATYGMRYDVLAKTYYKNKDDWWIIALANSGTKDTLMCKPGTQVRIPSNVVKIRSDFKKINGF